MRAAIVLFAAAVFLTGCGREERAEAIRLAKTLTRQQSSYAKADAIEKEFVSNARAWSAAFAASGAGRGIVLDQNATVATELAKSAVAISTELSQVSQAVREQTLNKEYPQGVRDQLMTQLMSRQRLLQDMRTLLDKSASQFREYRSSKTYTGDTYPSEIAKLSAMLERYKPPEDAVAAALNALKSNYKLKSSEL